MICCKQEFPIFEKRFDVEGIVYADSAATTLKPQSVINEVSSFYDFKTVNVMRGGSSLSEETTIDYLKVREKLAGLINSRHDEVVLTKGATDSLNIICDGLGIGNDDEVIVSVLEHHSNIAPWINKCRVKFAVLDSRGVIDVGNIEKLISPKTKLIAITYVSNVTGIIQPIGEISQIARKYGVFCLVDASQAISHIPIDVNATEVDFLCFSGHKMFGPSGVGCFFGKKEHLAKLHVTRFGGGMVDDIGANTELTLKGIPYSLEPGTPNIEGVLGLGKAVDFIEKIGIDQIEKHNSELVQKLLGGLSSISGVRILYPDNVTRVPIVTFRVFPEKIDQSHIARILGDSHKIILSYGKQCASPLYNYLRLDGAIRASFHVYSSLDEISYFVECVDYVAKLWRR